MIDIEKLAKESGVNHWSDLSLKQFAEAYAAKVLEDKEREIAELKQERNDLNYLCMDRLHKIEELQANNNDLRDALAEIKLDSTDTNSFRTADKALLKTPAQSLQEHDNEVIERCAKVCDMHANSSWNDDRRMQAKLCRDEIRALKGKQND